MASSSNQPNRPTSYASTPDRPATIAELAAFAQRETWDPTLPLKHWLRTAEKARKAGQAHVETQNYEAAFVEFARAATIVLEKLPTHADYYKLLSADQRQNLGMVSIVVSALASYWPLTNTQWVCPIIFVSLSERSRYAGPSQPTQKDLD